MQATHKRRAFVLSGLLVIVLALSCWVLTGANRGWTRTERTTLATDEITGIEYPVVTKAFEPGIELLGASLLLGAGLLLTARLCGKAKVA